jgi:hypothetical protein
MPPPAPELSLREKIEKKASEVNARRSKDPKTGQFLSKTPQTAPANVDPITPAAGAPDPLKPAGNAVIPATPGAFVPKFKVTVDKQEREIPEFLKPLIKDADTEKQVHELVEKAYGLEFNKPRLEAARTENTQLKTQLGTISQENTAIRGQIQNLVTLYNRNDMDGWFKALGVPEEKVLQWMASKVNYSQLPPEQRSIIDQQKQAEERAWQAETQVQQVQTQNERLLTQQVQGQLESVLARPDVKSVADAFDARVGQPGAFRNEINRRGDYVWKTRKEIVSPDTLVQEMMSFLGPVAPPAAASPPAPAPQAPAAPQTPPPGPASKTPTIPNISGRSTSALRAPVRSIADIRERLKDIKAGS